jgi:hypothetical protein
VNDDSVRVWTRTIIVRDESDDEPCSINTINQQANKEFYQSFLVDGRYKGRYESVLPVVGGGWQIQRQIQLLKADTKADTTSDRPCEKRAFWPNLADTEANGERKTDRVAVSAQ